MTLVFFISAIVFSVLRELAMEESEYYVAADVIRIMGVPILLPLGWTFSLYCSWTVADILLVNSPRRRRMFPVFALAVTIMGLISFCVETTGGNVGWWTWKWVVFDSKWMWMPMEIIAGWMLTAVIFFIPFLYLECTAKRSKPIWWKLLFIVILGAAIALSFSFLSGAVGMFVLIFWAACFFLKGPELIYPHVAEVLEKDIREQDGFTQESEQK